MLRNTIIHKGDNEFFDWSKAHRIKSGLANPYLAKEFEKKKFRDPVKMIKEDWPDPDFK